MEKNKFFICEHCGNIIEMIYDAGVPIMCCGQKMKLIEPVLGASVEKHTPIVTVDGDNIKVVVGTTTHPMTKGHSISWVYLQTDCGGHQKYLKQDGDPIVRFVLKDEKPITVYAYCNLHGLWKKDILKGEKLR